MKQTSKSRDREAGLFSSMCSSFALTLSAVPSWPGVAASESPTRLSIPVSPVTLPNCNLLRSGAENATCFAFMLDCINACQARHVLFQGGHEKQREAVKGEVLGWSLPSLTFAHYALQVAHRLRRSMLRS